MLEIWKGEGYKHKLAYTITNGIKPHYKFNYIGEMKLVIQINKLKIQFIYY